MLFAGESLR